MTASSDKIPFSIEISRVIELLAGQIYPTPFALLRENVQNSFDAILIRRHEGDEFEPRISVDIDPQHVRVQDNGIGMSRDDLRTHFWRAGSSSKNTDEARAAGVVGTFGIGAMANFGIAETLSVETENTASSERTRCVADRSTLSVTEDCITFETMPPTGNPGTIVEATMQNDKTVNVVDAVNYISEFVAYLPIDVLVNGVKASGHSVASSVAPLSTSWSFEENGVDCGGGLHADIGITGAATGEVRVALENIRSGDQLLTGQMVLRQGVATVRTFRSGFGLATVNLSSIYQFGGIADFLFLQPTAGREALTTASMQMLQNIVTRIDSLVSEKLAARPEANNNSNFVVWAARNKRYDLCGKLRVRIEPGDNVSLDELALRSRARSVLVYAGTDTATIQHASEDRPLVMLSRNAQRRECELGYLRSYCDIEELSDAPKILKEKNDREFTGAEQALAFRIASILSTDYFIDVRIRFGTISHGLPLLLVGKKPIELCIDPSGTTAHMLLDLYEREYAAFGHMAKDFVRTMVFPKVADLVPSATRLGAEAFLKTVGRSREVFEYEADDLESLTSIWDDYLGGKLSFTEASTKSQAVARRSFQYVDSSASGAVRDVVPDVIENQQMLPSSEPDHGPQPPFQRGDVKTDRKVLTIADDETALRGYRCFLAITDKVWEEKGDFFLQPHRTSVVWGGQRALFVFEHHSGEFGLYYDLQTQSPLSVASGGGSFETCTIVMKNRVFIPIPTEIQAGFIPEPGEKKRFEVRCDILYIELQPAA